jgi:hypothetical protein
LINDGLLEVVGVKGAAEMVKFLFFFPEISVIFIEFSLKSQGTLTSGLAKPMKIAQGSHISILFQPQLESEEPSLLSVQVRNFKEIPNLVDNLSAFLRCTKVDGEPFVKKSPCTIEINFNNKVSMLKNSNVTNIIS